MHITPDEVRKLAKMARIQVTEDEIDAFAKQLQDVLGYAERVCQIAADVEATNGVTANGVAADVDEKSREQRNVLRPDVPVSSDAQVILDQAPEREERLFVVPHIMGKQGE